MTTRPNQGKAQTVIAHWQVKRLPQLEMSLSETII
jgi:hypothetical protein